MADTQKTYGVRANPFYLDSDTALNQIRNPEPKFESVDMPDFTGWGSKAQTAPQQTAVPAPAAPVAQAPAQAPDPVAAQPVGPALRDDGLPVIGGTNFRVVSAPPPSAVKAASEPVKDEGVMDELSRGISHGVKVTTPKMIGQALQFFGAEETGGNMVKSAEARETEANKESQYGQNLDSPWSVRGNVYEAADNAVMSLAPGAAGAAVGAGIGAGFFGIGAVPGALIGYGLGSLASLPFFYGSQAQESYEKVKKAQLDSGAAPEKAESEARWAAHESGSIEAGGELIADVIPFAKLFKPLAKPVTKVTANAVKDILFPTFKEGAKTVAKTVGGEVLTEMGQQAGEAAVEGAHGAGPGATWEDTSRVIMPTALMSLIPGMAGAGSHHAKVVATRKAMENPDTDPELRTKIALGVVANIQEGNPDAAKNFALYAGNQIQNNLPIEMGNNDFYQTQAEFLRTGKVAPGNNTTSGTTQDGTLNRNVTELDDDAYVRNEEYFKNALDKNRDKTLGVLAAIVQQEKIGNPDMPDNQNPVINAITAAATRLSILPELNEAMQSGDMVALGNQVLSDNPHLRDTILVRADRLATTLPAASTPKKDNRISVEPKVESATEEDVMNMPFPEDSSSQSHVVEKKESPAFLNLSEQIKTAENPGTAFAQALSEMAHSTDPKALEGWHENLKDKYGVITYDSPDSKSRVFTHPLFPGMSFNTRDDLFDAFKLQKVANESFKQNRSGKIKEETSANGEPQSEGAPDINPDLLFGEPDDLHADEANKKLDEARAGLDDAMYHLWDVASDASGGKMNITGQRYTAKDLPKAIQKVMEALVKLGYVKFSDITEKLMERMKANDNWKHLVDKVTPQMLRDAYNKLPSFEGKEQLNAPAQTGPKKNVTDLIKALPAVVKDVVQKNETFDNMSDLGILIKRRMEKDANWSHLTPKVTDGMVRTAYEQATKSMANRDESEQTGTYTKGFTTSAETIANRKIEAEKQEETQEQYTPKERSDIEKRKADLESKINRIVSNVTNGSFYQGVVNGIISRINELDKQISAINRIEVTNEDGSVTTYFRRQEGEAGMEEQVAEAGRRQDSGEYYEYGDRISFENPDSKSALLAKKRILELELRNAMNDKVSKQAQQGKLGIRVIRRQIDDAIQAAVREGLPVEETIDIGRKWLTGIDNYIRLPKAERAEKAAQEQAELQEMIDNMNKSVEEAELPSDYEFAFGIFKDLSSRKINLQQAIELIDQAASRSELDDKRNVVSHVLTELIDNFRHVYEAKLAAAKKSGANIATIQDEAWADHPASTFAYKYKKDGLLRFDDLQDLFQKNNADMPHSVIKSSEVAASKGLMDYMTENKFDVSYRYYWLRSMDRVVHFNPSLLKSPMFTDLERDLYSEWRSDVGDLNNRRRAAYEKAEYGSLLFNKFSLDQMRDPSKLSNNERMRLKEMFGDDLVTAYFNDMVFASRIGYGKDLASKLDPADRQEWEEFLNRKNKQSQDEADRLERQKYFGMLSQFKHISDPTFDKLYQMMKSDSVANLPMIYDMALAIEMRGIKGMDVDVDTGEITKIKTKSQIEEEVQKLKSGEPTTIFTQTKAAPTQNENELFEQNVLSAMVHSMTGGRGVSNATLGGDPIFDFNTYNANLDNKFVSYEEGQGEQNRNAEDEDMADRMLAGEDFEMDDDEVNRLLGEVDENKSTGEDSDNYRLRQGQYVGFLNTAVVMNQVSQITKNWKNAPNIVVLQNHLQLPEGIREEVTRKLQNGMGAKGLYDGSTGTIYLFSNHLSSMDDVQFTLFHEAYGHLGLRLMFGQEFDTFLNNIYNSNANVRRAADARFSRGGVGKLEAVEEVLSDMAGDNRETGAVKQFIGQIIAGLRKIGLDRVANYLGGFTDAELSYALAKARDYAEDAGGYSPLVAGPSDIRLSEEFPPYEIFAKRGMKTTGYARYDPLVGSYYLFTSTNGDIRQGSTMRMVDSMDEVVSELEKLGTLERRRRSGFFRDNNIAEDFVKIKHSKEAGWMQTKLDGLVRSLANQYLPVFRVVEQMEKIGRITSDLDLRKYLRTTERQTAVMVEDFNRNYVQKIYDLMMEAEKAGGDFSQAFGATNVYEMLNKFLLAQTAEERNKQVNKRNPEEYAGSGMASASSVAADPAKHPIDTASEILNFVESQPYAEQFKKIGKLLDKMSDAKIDWEEKTGLISSGYFNKKGEYVPGEADKRRQAYEHYRNLSGVNLLLDEDHSGDPYLGDPSHNIFRKFNARGKDKYALGRHDESPDILARTIAAAEASIIRGNKNLISQRILAFFETNYDPNYVVINEQAKIKQIGADGFVNIVDKPNYYNQPDVFIAKVNGIPVTMRFKDTGYLSVIEAIHGRVEPQSEHPIRQLWQMLGHGLGAMITKYNPYWIPVNFVRDVQTMFLNAAVNADVGTAQAAKMMKNLLPAMGTTIRIALMDMHVSTPAGKKAKQFLLDVMEGKPGAVAAVAIGGAAMGAVLPGLNIIASAAIGGLIGSFASNSKAAQQRMAMYHEGRKNGAFTSFINRKDLDSQIVEIEKAMKGRTAIDKMTGFLKFWELVTIPVEMAPRLAAYMVMRDSGRSALDSADFSGGITVDFNMRGANEWTRALYLFFNPAVQGTAQMARLAKLYPGRFAMASGGLFMIGFLSSMLTRLGGDDDDDEAKARRKAGVAPQDQIPDYKRATSLIYAPNERGGAIPVAYGWNAPFAAGVFMADSVVGQTPWSLSAKRTIQAAFEAFSPIGGSGFDLSKVTSEPVRQAILLFSPTGAAPVAQWELNTNRNGAPIYPTAGSEETAYKSDTTRAFKSVNPISQWITDNLQEATGGEKRNREGVDINPALIDHISDSYLPGLISSYYRAAGLQVRKDKGYDIPREKEPLADRFSAYGQEEWDAAAFRRIFTAVTNVSNEMMAHPTRDDRFKQLAAKYPGVSELKDVVNSAKEELEGMRQEVRDLEDDAYMLRKDGQLDRAKAMEAAAVQKTNQVKKESRKIFKMVVDKALKSNFADVVYSD